MLRVCIKCRRVYGCVKNKIRLECERCRFAKGCAAPHAGPVKFAANSTGGLCDECFRHRKALKAKNGRKNGPK